MERRKWDVGHGEGELTTKFTKGREIALFTVDHMLIGLGRYLRILGYDTYWNAALRTHELILRSNAENRIFVSRNTRLSEQYPAVDEYLIIQSEDPSAQLREVIDACGLDCSSYLFSRCVNCNVELVQVPAKEEIKARVHPNVYNRYDQFFVCPDCGQVYWKGSHVRNTITRLGL